MLSHAQNLLEIDGFLLYTPQLFWGEVEDLSTQSEILPIKKKGIPVSEKEFYFFKIVVQQGN